MIFKVRWYWRGWRWTWIRSRSMFLLDAGPLRLVGYHEDAEGRPCLLLALGFPAGRRRPPLRRSSGPSSLPGLLGWGGV